MTTATAQQSQVTQHSHELCMALLTDFIEHSIRSQKRSLANATEQYSIDYHQSQIDSLKAGNADYDFYLDKGRKYYKLIMKDSSGSQSVHAFIDRNTGDVYKPAGWKGPAKYVRYNLLDEESRERCFEVADWAGGYLYMS